MYKILLFIAMSTLIWSACVQTDQPDPIAEVPVFNISLQPNNPDMDSVSLVAGEDDIYLFTQTEYSAEVLRMTGSFASVDCPNGDCPGSVQIEFRNNVIGPFAMVDTLFGKNRSWTYKSIFFDDPPYFDRVTVQWVTENGAKLRTDVTDVSPLDSVYFTVISAEPWENNERNEKTWKMNVDFLCWMADSTTQQQVKVHGNGVIAVAYR